LPKKSEKSEASPTHRGQPYKKEISRAATENYICFETAQPPAMMQAAVYANDYDR
jgi:hypothetical protein